MPKFNDSDSLIIFQRDVLNFLLPTDKYCAHSGGLLHFRKYQGKERIEQVYPAIPSTANAPALPEIRVFPTLSEDEDSAELIAPDGEGGASLGDK